MGKDEYPIHVVKETEVIHGEEFLPGWYFWDEIWSYRHGPFATKEEAEVALNHYCKVELGA